MIEASVKVACIFVDCDWGKKNRDLAGQFKVTGYPTVILLDRDANYVGHLAGRDPAVVAKDLQALAGLTAAVQEGPVHQINALGWDDARKMARKLKQPIAFYFYDDSPASRAVNTALMEDLTKGVIMRFVWAKSEYSKNSPEAARFGVTRAPTILLLDPTLERPESKPLGRIVGSKSARELVRELQEIFVEALPATDPGAPPTPTPKPAPKENPLEKLSDDQVERLFIQARVAVAKDMVKRGEKKKAIEVYEDLIKTYPKHVDTVEVKKLLEETRK